MFRAAMAECDAPAAPAIGLVAAGRTGNAGGPVAAGPDRVRPAGVVRDPGGACRAVAILGRPAGCRGGAQRGRDRRASRSGRAEPGRSGADRLASRPDHAAVRPALAAWRRSSLSEAEARAVVAPFGERLSIGAINAPNSVVLSGEPAALDASLATLAARGIRPSAAPGTVRLSQRANGAVAAVARRCACRGARPAAADCGVLDRDRRMRGRYGFRRRTILPATCASRYASPRRSAP